MSLNTRKKPFIIGISGVTCGGKTTLAEKLKNTLKSSILFNQDQYFYPDDSSKHIKCEDLNHNNYDILSSLDMETMFNDIAKVIKDMDYTYVIIEGFTILNYEPINEICDFRYYFTLDYNECLRRRLSRTYDPPDIPGYFEKCVWPEHVRYKDELINDTRIKFIDGKRDDSFDIVLNDLGVNK